MFSPKALTQKQKDDVDKIRPYIGDQSADKIGKFQEDVGGGTPAQGGGRGAMNKDFVVADDPDDPKAIKAKAEGEAVRYKQPRKDNGQFTYNSANAKKLYYGAKSRGYTKVPFLLQKLAEKTEKEGTDVVIGQDQLSYLFHNKDLSAYKAEQELREYMTEHGKQDYTDSGKNIIKRSEQSYEHKKGRKSAAEQQALQQGITGKIGERKTVNGKTKYSYLSKAFTPAGPGVMNKYFDANGNPIGTNVIKPNNPNITPKTVKQAMQNNINKLKGNTQQPAAAANSTTPSQNVQNAQPKQQQPAAPKPQQPVAPAQSKPVDYSQKIDASAVSNDPKKFIADNRDAINGIVSKANELGLKFNVNMLVDAAKNGEISSLQDVVNMLNSYKK